ncbi:S-methyl-5-thioribose-1-phosphate isomerase [Mactra antiquata]
MTLEAIKYQRGHLDILDQLLLPFKSQYVSINDTESAWIAIKKMQVRGAPAIAIVGCLSLAVELLNQDFDCVDEVSSYVSSKLEYLVSARPTAVNMKEAADRYSNLVKELALSKTEMVESIKQKMIDEFEQMFIDDVSTNKSLSDFGCEAILDITEQKPAKVLTHCNTGSLATAGYGTALGVIRKLHERNTLEHAYCTETRPYNQGARLTAYELVFEKIPSTLICDSMVSMVMKTKNITAVVVGADRVVQNGDTANKIGTYQIAIAAKYHNIPFFVACPSTTFDPNMKTGEEIIIEERPANEMSSIKGVPIAAEGINCYNPAFDVTPAELITGGIITEFGVFKPESIYSVISSEKNQRKK